MKKKLLVICPHYDTFIKTQTESLSEYFETISVLIPKWSSVFARVDREFFSAKKNIKLYFVAAVSPLLFISHRKVTDFIYKNNIEFDVVLSHFLVPYGFLGNSVASHFHKKSVIIAHGFDIYDLPFRNIFYKKLIQGILHKADKIITVSESNLKCIDKLGFKEKATVIPNSFDSSLFYPQDKKKCRLQLGVPNDKKVVLTVGNLVPIKNQKTLIDAVSSMDDVLCYIIGEGPLKDKLQKQIDTINVSDRVFLVGHKPHSEIPLWMNACDVFVLPSIREGNPTVLFETLGCGIPFIGSSVGGIPEIIVSEKYGFIFENNHTRTLSLLLKESLNKNWKRKVILGYAKNFESLNISKKIYLELV